MALGRSIGMPGPMTVDAYRLTTFETGFKFKDLSKDTFPGDHGTVLIIVTGFALFYLKKQFSIAILLMSLFIVMPRVVVGAHWLTDEIVGAIAVGFVVLAWFLMTPLSAILMEIAERIWCWVLKNVMRMNLS